MKEKLRELTRGMWTVPNALTMLRLVLVPVFAALYLAGHTYPALIVFCVASITDMFDGLLARKLNQITSFGKVFDPLADKLMVLTTLVCHVVKGVFPWPPLAVIAAKELIMVIGGTLLVRKGVVPYANLYGKVATVFFMAALIAGFFHRVFLEWGFALDELLLWTAVGLALFALGNYAWKGIRQLKDPPADGGSF